MQQVARYNLWVHSQSKCVQIQSVLIKCGSQELHNVPEQPSKDLWTCKIIKRGQSNVTKCWSQECLFARHINHENVPTTFLSIFQAERLQNGFELQSKQLRFWTHKSWKFVQKLTCKPWRRSTCEMRLNFTANSFIFGRTYRGIAPRTFCKTSRQRTSKMRLNFRANSFVFGWGNCAHNFFFQTCRQRTSRMRLNFTVNSFVFVSTNRGIASRTFSFKLAGRELPKCVWTSQQTASFLDA